jgi:HPt (histidine-containing phosphotransfer) domain-containing protein
MSARPAKGVGQMAQARDQLPAIYSSLAADPMLASLVAEFVSEIPVRIARLTRQLSAQDWPGLHRTAHQLKGAAGSYGFEELTAPAHRVEQLLAEDAETKMVSEAVRELVACCQRITAGVPQPAPPLRTQR